MIRAFTRLYLQVLAGLKASGFSFMPLSLKSVGAIAQFWLLLDLSVLKCIFKPYTTNFHGPSARGVRGGRKSYKRSWKSENPGGGLPNFAKIHHHSREEGFESAVIPAPPTFRPSAMLRALLW